MLLELDNALDKIRLLLHEVLHLVKDQNQLARVSAFDAVEILVVGIRLQPDIIECGDLFSEELSLLRTVRLAASIIKAFFVRDKFVDQRFLPAVRLPGQDNQLVARLIIDIL